MGRRGIAAAAFLHSVTVNTTMSLAERYRGDADFDLQPASSHKLLSGMALELDHQ
jgi:hypothetical protein